MLTDANTSATAYRYLRHRFEGLFHSGVFTCERYHAFELRWRRRFGSFLVDYKFNKHFDVYTGVSYSEIGGGLASGYRQDTEVINVVSGLRLKF